MNSTRTGKIARLPKAIRDELNQRIENGESAPKLIEWLNADPHVQETLQEYFAGRPINSQNISEWRSGGYQDWLELQQTRALATQFVESGQTVGEDLGDQKISEHMTTLLAVEFARVSQLMLRSDMDLKQRFACLCDIHRQFSRLRRDDCRVSKSAIQGERWRRQVNAEDEAAEKAFEAEIRRKRVQPLKLGALVKAKAEWYGGGDLGHDIAAFILEQENDLPEGALGRQTKEFAADSDTPSDFSDAIPENPAPEPTTASISPEPEATSPTPPSASGTPEAELQTPSISGETGIVALDNEIRPINPSEMAGIRVNQAKNGQKNFSNTRCHHPCPSQFS